MKINFYLALFMQRTHEKWLALIARNLIEYFAMDSSLLSHQKSYSLSFRDCVFSLATGFSGFPYAKRHWELSKKENLCRHQVIAVFEALPLLGGLIALIECIAVFASQFFDSLSQKSPALEQLKARNVATENLLREIENYLDVLGNINQAINRISEVQQQLLAAQQQRLKKLEQQHRERGISILKECSLLPKGPEDSVKEGIREAFLQAQELSWNCYKNIDFKNPDRSALDIAEQTCILEIAAGNFLSYTHASCLLEFRKLDQQSVG